MLLLALAGCPPANEPAVTGSVAPSVTAPVSGAPEKIVGPATNVQLPDDVVPQAYRLDLAIDPAKTTFQGSVEIDVDVRRATDTVVLHARELKLSKSEVVVGGRAIAAKASQRAAYGAREGTEELVLQLAQPLPVGQATLRFAYEAPFGNLNGIYRAESDGKAYAFSQMEPTDARRAFPSFDEPRYKTPFELTVEVPSGMTAVSNAKEIAREAAGAATRIKFAKTAPIATYLFAVGVGDLEVLDGARAPTPIRFVATHGRAGRGAATLDAADKSLRALEAYFARPYPFGKLDVASVPNFGAGAMENAGLVTFREELVDLDDHSPALWRRRMQIIMAHELSHQWFGNLVTMQWWDDLWLNEGFATWMAPKIADEAFAGYGARVERVIDSTYAMNADVLASSRPVRPRVDLSDQIREAGGWTAYTKGAAVLTMLEAWIGEQPFRQGIRDYVDANAGRSITSKALFSALDAATKKPVTKVASSFLDQRGVPLVGVHVACDAHAVELTAVDASGGSGSWTTPVCIRVQGQKEPKCTLLDGSAKATIALPADAKACPWVFPDAGETGYFRYELDPPEAKRLIDGFSELDETERAGLLLDAWALVLLGRASPSSVVELLAKVSTPKETSRVVVEAIINVLGELDRYYVDDKNAAAFHAFVKKVLGPHRKRLGMPVKGEPDAILVHRVDVLAALYDLADDATVAKELEPIAVKFLDAPASADANLGPLAVRVSVHAGGAALSKLDEARLAKAASPDERVTLVAAIASRREPKALKQALELFVKGTIRAGDWRHLRNAVLRRRETATTFFDFLRERFDPLLKQLGWASALTGTIGATCDAAELQRLTAFFEPKLSTLEGAQRGFDEGVADAKRCIAVRAKGVPAF